MKKNLLRGDYLFTIITKLVIVLVSFINTIIINRYLGPELRGYYSYILNICNILILILNLGIGQSYVFYKKNSVNEVKSLFITLSLFQFILYFFILFTIKIFTNNEAYNYIAIVTIFGIINNQILFIALIENVKTRNKINLISNFIYTAILLFVYFFSNSNISLIVYSLGIRYFVEVILCFKYFNMYNNLRFKALNKNIIIEILKFGSVQMIISVLITFNYNIDVIIMKKFLGYADIGIYSLGVTLANMLWIIPDAFKDVLFNKSARKNSINTICKSISINIVVSLIITTVFIFIGREFIELFYGKEFLNAYKVSIILFLGTIPMIFFKLITPLYTSIGKQRRMLIVLILSNISNIVANFMLIPELGIIGAAISSVASYSLCGLIFLFYFIRENKVKLNYFKII